MAKVLIVEDDQEVAYSIRDWLTMENHTVDMVHDGAEGLERISHYTYDLAVLDLDLPGMNGIDLCAAYRDKGGMCYIIMLTGKDELTDKERGLDAGADDYLTKPFHVRELSARIRALTRRSSRMEAPSNLIKIRDIELDQKARTISKAGASVHLLPKEYALLEFLMKHPGEIFSQEAIMERVWSSESDASPDTVRVHIRKIRAKLDDSSDSALIQTVHRQGYRLDP